MIERFWANPPRGLVRLVLTVGPVAAVTPFVALLHILLPEPNLAVLYLPAVMLVAVLAGAAPALVAAVAGFLAYDFLFVAPHFTLTMSDPEEWANLFMFLAAAIATGQLAGFARARAVQATRNERDATTQFRLVQALTDQNVHDGIRAAAQIVPMNLTATAETYSVPRFGYLRSGGADGTVSFPISSAPTGTSPRFFTNGADKYNCTSFGSQAEAQEALSANAPGDPNKLDMNANGVACEDISYPANTPKDLTPIANR